MTAAVVVTLPTWGVALFAALFVLIGACAAYRHQEDEQERRDEPRPVRRHRPPRSHCRRIARPELFDQEIQ